MQERKVPPLRCDDRLEDGRNGNAVGWNLRELRASQSVLERTDESGSDAAHGVE